MIELKYNQLFFSFPEIHPSARLRLKFQRTLRIPDDDRNYPLPPGLGHFRLRHVDDVADRVPESWVKHGGVILPMYQAEAMWMEFNVHYGDNREICYPLAIKVATGKINAISGESWSKGIHRKPCQDYVVASEQPWLDGYCVEKGVIRQFVAMPLGADYTAEEQITGEAEHGGLQIEVFPMKRQVFERRFPIQPRSEVLDYRPPQLAMLREPGMGLAPGGRMKQNIEEDPYNLDDWDLKHSSRCFVHIANSMVWHQITGNNPPQPPLTAKEYNEAGLPWFDWYDDKSKPLQGSKKLAELKSVSHMGQKKKEKPLPENESVEPKNVFGLRAGLKPGQVREFEEA